ncbi:MAG: hypothetical protein HQM09_04715 [Candidatus Riflebacteria bacterium]|nr:hypothetical protein [Candidatus Riflebacteria bacterium]
MRSRICLGLLVLAGLGVSWSPAFADDQASDSAKPSVDKIRQLISRGREEIIRDGERRDSDNGERVRPGISRENIEKLRDKIKEIRDSRANTQTSASSDTSTTTSASTDTSTSSTTSSGGTSASTDTGTASDSVNADVADGRRAPGRRFGRVPIPNIKNHTKTNQELTADDWANDVKAYNEAIARGDYSTGERLINKWKGFCRSDFDGFKKATGFTGTQESAMAMISKAFADTENERVNGQITADTLKRDAETYKKAFADKNWSLCRDIINKWTRYINTDWAAVAKATGVDATDAKKQEMLNTLSTMQSDLDKAVAAAGTATNTSTSTATASSTATTDAVAQMKQQLSDDCTQYAHLMATGKYDQAEALVSKWLRMMRNPVQRDLMVKALGIPAPNLEAYIQKVFADTNCARVNGETINADLWKRDCAAYAAAMAAGDYATCSQIAKKWDSYCDDPVKFEAVKAATGYTGSLADAKKFFKDVFADLFGKTIESSTINADKWQKDYAAFQSYLAAKDFANCRVIIARWRNYVTKYPAKIKSVFGVTADQANAALDSMEASVKSAEAATATATATSTGTTTGGDAAASTSTGNATTPAAGNASSSVGDDVNN